MEIHDKRKFDGDGNLVAVAEEKPAISEQQFSAMLADIPRVYEEPSPMTNHILVKQSAKETTYAGTRFVIPDSAQQSPNEGIVVAIGPDINPEYVKPGDLVTFGRFNAEPVSIGGEEFVLVCFHDIKLRQKVVYAINA
jgi:co-chaperonin GroES (HSP10)